MTFGTGPQALADTLAENWEPVRAGRADVPPATTEQRSQQGTVFITHDRDEVSNTNSVHDLIHCYHPQSTGIGFEDKGYNEQGATETVQIDIDCTDRVDPDTGERLSAKQNMVGDRDTHQEKATTDGGGTLGGTGGFTLGGEDGATLGNHTPEFQPYPGIMGEVLYILESVTRKGFAEYDVARKDVVNLQLYNSNAVASINVDLEWISVNTA